MFGFKKKPEAGSSGKLLDLIRGQSSEPGDAPSPPSPPPPQAPAEAIPPAAPPPHEAPPGNGKPVPPPPPSPPPPILPPPPSGSTATLPGGEDADPARFFRLDFNQAVFGRLQYSLDAIWGNIMVSHTRTPHSIIISGSGPGEGVTMVTQTLALHLALGYKSRVLYVNCAPAGRHGWPQGGSSDGLLEALVEGQDVATMVMATDVDGLYVLPYGGAHAKQAQAFVIQRPGGLENFVARTRSLFDFVICNGKSVLMAPWTVSIAKHMDINLLVCRYAISRREVLSRVVDTFTSGGAKVDGVILNDRQFPIPMKLYKRMK